MRLPESARHLLDYVAIDTQSDETSHTIPTTPGQSVLLDLLQQRIQDYGLKTTRTDGVLYGILEATDGSDKSYGFLAHVDTAREESGKDVRPCIHENYDGQPIRLKDGIVLDPQLCPALKRCTGKTVITTDGTTLLGGDDKAGCAILTSALHQLCESGCPHPQICVAFTTDEETGRGVDTFDASLFPAHMAWTLDGDEIRAADYENFNAAKAILTIYGTVIHPGEGKDHMVNAVREAVRIADQLPTHAAPETTDGHQGYVYLEKLEGTASKAQMTILIRSFDKEEFLRRKAWFESLVHTRQLEFAGTLELDLHDQYYNMKDWIQDIECVDRARRAIEKAGLTPISRPIRGGTDGAMLTVQGLDCPNLGTGSWNHHSRKEFACAEDMEIMKEIVVTLMEGK